jgi:hypothetical protein
LRENEKDVRQVVLFDEAFPRLEQVFLPFALRIRRRGRWSVTDLPAIPVPGRNLDDGRDPEFFGDAQRLQAIARPTVEKIVASAGKMARRDPIEILLFRPVIIRPIAVS